VTATDHIDAYATHVGVRLVAASPARAVVEQPALDVLDNHVGIRHASALYAAAWAASQALVLAALGERPAAGGVTLTDSEIRYEQVPLGLITTVAEPAGGDWDAPGRDGAELRATAISTNDQGRTVVALDTTWRVG
jgi:Domain of unknown function (DUF4442)